MVLAIVDMYTDSRWFAAVTMLLPSEHKPMYTLDAVPHVSLYKNESITWADVGYRTKIASSATDYHQGDDGWSCNPSCNMWKHTYHDVATGDAKMHALS